MSGYADEAEAAAVLGRDGTSTQDLADHATLGTLNTDLTAEIDDYTQRTFAASGTLGAPVTWTRDAPYGSVLPLPDFYQLVGVTINGVSVLSSVLSRALIPGSGPPWQLLIYAPAGVPTGWATGLPTPYDMIAVQVLAGYASVPRPVVRMATRALIREWKARVAMYSGSAGDASVTVLAPPGLLTDDDKARLAGYVRPRVAAIRGGG
jgi:hypothetical protein